MYLFIFNTYLAARIWRIYHFTVGITVALASVAEFALPVASRKAGCWANWPRFRRILADCCSWFMLILWSGSAVTRTTGDQWRVSCLMRIRSRGKFYTLTVSSTKMYDIWSSLLQESLSAGISRETAWLIISFVASRITTFTISCNFMHLCLDNQGEKVWCGSAAKAQQSTLGGGSSQTMDLAALEQT